MSCWLRRLNRKRRRPRPLRPNEAASQRLLFAVCSFLNLLEAGIGASNPITGRVHFRGIDRHGPWELFVVRDAVGSPNRLCLLNRVFPMMTKLVERVVHGPGFHRAYPAAAHRVVKHAIAFLPGAVVLLVGDIVQDRCVSIFTLEWSAHNRPKRFRNGGAVDDRASWSDPDDAFRIGIAQVV